MSGIVKYPDMYMPVDVDGDDARRPTPVDGGDIDGIYSI